MATALNLALKKRLLQYFVDKGALAKPGSLEWELYQGLKGKKVGRPTGWRKKNNIKPS